MNQEAGGQLLPAPLVDLRVPNPQDKRDSWHVSFLDREHPALARLAEPASLYESVLVYKHFRMAAGPQARVLARLDDGEPLLVGRSAGRGKTLMLGTSAQVNWSNLPLRPIFLPLVTQLTFDLAGLERANRNLIAGQPLALPLAALPAAAGPAEVEVTRPGGETLRLATDTKARPVVAGEGATTGRGFVPEFRYDDTHEIGVYLLRPVGAAAAGQTAYSVNFDPDEADPARIQRQQLEGLLDGAPLVVADSPDDLSGVFAQLREGKSLWSAFLAAVLVVLVFETFVSNRISCRAAASDRGSP
jgi:hypothetical protein